MFCEKCFKSFAECKCYTGEARVKQYVHLIRKEMNAIENVVLLKKPCYIRMGGVTKKAEIIKVNDQPLFVQLSAKFVFSEKDGWDQQGFDNTLHVADKILSETPPKYQPTMKKAIDQVKIQQQGIKLKVLTEAELLDHDKQRVFKQVFKELFVALKSISLDRYPGDSVTMNWTLGSASLKDVEET